MVKKLLRIDLCIHGNELRLLKAAESVSVLESHSRAGMKREKKEYIAHFACWYSFSRVTPFPVIYFHKVAWTGDISTAADHLIPQNLWLEVPEKLPHG